MLIFGGVDTIFDVEKLRFFRGWRDLTSSESEGKTHHHLKVRSGYFRDDSKDVPSIDMQKSLGA